MSGNLRYGSRAAYLKSLNEPNDIKRLNDLLREKDKRILSLIKNLDYLESIVQDYCLTESEVVNKIAIYFNQLNKEET